MPARAARRRAAAVDDGGAVKGDGGAVKGDGGAVKGIAAPNKLRRYGLPRGGLAARGGAS
jgi:hypothetical protein